MKFLLLGDGHITDRKPERRKDKDYLEALLNKLHQVERIGVERKCSCVLQVGDWFDSWRVRSNVVSEMIRFLRSSSMKWFCVWGQHDVYGHSAESFSYSSLRILQEAGLLEVLGAQATIIDDETKLGIHVYGAPFGQEVPKPIVEGTFNILVIHEMIGDVPLYPGQDLQNPASFLRMHPKFNLVVCGDYHYRFISKLGDRFCINPGALVRKTISEKDLILKPAVVVFDISGSYETVELDVVPTEEIFDLSRKEEKEDVDYERLLSFLDSMKESTSATIGWRNILEGLFRRKKVRSRVIVCIDSCSKEVTEAKLLT